LYYQLRKEKAARMYSEQCNARLQNKLADWNEARKKVKENQTKALTEDESSSHSHLRYIYVLYQYYFNI
jgi:hypothetical protein